MIKLTSEKTAIETYLKGKGLLSTDEHVLRTEKPGDGNMNFTLRVATGTRTFIVKQSRAYVEKYPQVAAPSDRVLREAEFYGLMETVPELAKMMPSILGLDKENHILLMEDLGESSDYTFLYKVGHTINEDELKVIMEFAANLHQGVTVENASKIIRNREMRALNHEHIFRYPFLRENGLDLDTILPGLKAASLPFKDDPLLQKKVAALGEIYLADGMSLLHGDYFPGSWLRTAAGVKIIDPEFCFFGPPEFEVGVTIAHLKLADQPENLINKALEHYKSFASLDDALREKFTAIEILRRILGLAQLPLQIDLEKRLELMDQARDVLLQQ